MERDFVGCLPPPQNTLVQFAETVQESLLAYTYDLVHRYDDPSIEPADIMQESFLLAWEKADKFHGTTADELLRWLKGIARLEVKNMRRRLQYQKRTRSRINRFYSSAHQRINELSSDSPGPLEQLEKREQLVALLRLLTKLTNMQCCLVQRVFFEEMSLREVSGELGIDVSYAYKTLRRAIDRLRTLLKNIGVVPE